MTEQRLIKVLKTLLQIDNLEVIRCAIESLIEELEDSKRSKNKE